MGFGDKASLDSSLPAKGLVNEEDSGLCIALQEIEPFLDALQLRYSQMWKDVRKDFGLEVMRPGACWIWPGFRDAKGYGMRIIGHRFLHIHRLAFEFYKGRIPKRMVVMHSCDTPPCFNPDHLFLGTQRENVQDMIRKGRHYSQKTRIHTVVARLTRKPKPE